MQLDQALKERHPHVIVESDLPSDRITLNIPGFDTLRFYDVEGVAYPSYSTLTKVTESEGSRVGLARWRKSLQNKLGIAGANAQQAMYPERGTAIHAAIEYFSAFGHWPEAEAIPNLSKYRDFYETVIETGHLQSIADELLLVQEAPLYSEELGVAGTPDRISLKQATKTLIIRDWKTSDKLKACHKENKKGYPTDPVTYIQELFPHVYGRSFNSRCEQLAVRFGQMVCYLDSYIERVNSGYSIYSKHRKLIKDVKHIQYELCIWNNTPKNAKKNPTGEHLELYTLDSKDHARCIDLIRGEIKERLQNFNATVYL